MRSDTGTTQMSQLYQTFDEPDVKNKAADEESRPVEQVQEAGSARPNTSQLYRTSGRVENRTSGRTEKVRDYMSDTRKKPPVREIWAQTGQLYQTFAQLGQKLSGGDRRPTEKQKHKTKK